MPLRRGQRRVLRHRRRLHPAQRARTFAGVRGHQHRRGQQRGERLHGFVELDMAQAAPGLRHQQRPERGGQHAPGDSLAGAAARPDSRRHAERGGIAPFDLVFIDADKAGYARYLDALLESPLLAPNAVIAVDNTLMQGQPYRDGTPATDNGRAIADFNAAVAADDRVEQVLVPIRDGVTLIRRVGTRSS